MHILIDLQASQSNSAKRGIGRYSLSLTKAFLENSNGNRISVLLNGTFQESIDLIKKELEGLLSENDFFIWYPPKKIQFIDPNNSLKRKSAELIREAYIHEISPDILVNMSLFEGLQDDSVLSIGAFSNKINTVTVLYDLIPYIYPEQYLQNEHIKKWYLGTLDHLRQSTLLLAISESSKQEAINYLGFEESKVINILGDADPKFKIMEYSNEVIRQTLQQYQIVKPFLMYTGGIDFRKNIEKLIEAYSLLSNDIKETYQLLVVCSIQQDEKAKLLKVVAECGLTEKDVIFTGYIPDKDLILLYNCCKLFVFPSWHEGFGLPVLEAMRCGVPVVASNLSSLPEIVGNEIALFNPLCVHSISDKIKEVLSNQELYQQLKKHSEKQAKKFSWNSSSIKALKAFESIYEENKEFEWNYNKEKLIQRPRLAYISPLPPAKSGIANYSAELIPELIKYYTIDVIVAQAEVDCPEVTASCNIRDVQWFRKNASKFDKIVYHFGNSEFHNYMFPLLEAFPGVVVLHDFFLGGIHNYRENHLKIANAMNKELYNAHGYKAVQEWNTEIDKIKVIMHYPCSYGVLKNATSIIVHSNHSIDLAKRWYGTNSIQKFKKIPHLRKSYQKISKENVRKILGIDKDDFLICCFGILASTKRNLELLTAFSHSEIGKRINSKLIFVGYIEEESSYSQQINDYIRDNDLTGTVKITGWVDDKTLMNYLAATDMAVQLRANSRGETSGTILDCLNFGVATIVNANETFNELPEDIIHKISNDFDQQELIDALDFLALDSHLRENYSVKGKNYIKLYHQPQKCAKEYFESIEKSQSNREVIKKSLISNISDLNSPEDNDESYIQIANAIAKNFPSNCRQKQLFIDITELQESQINTGIQRVLRNIVLYFIANPLLEYRVEPIYWNNEEQSYCYARNFTCQLLEIESVALEDELLQVTKGDIYLGLDLILKQLLNALKKLISNNVLFESEEQLG